jgi:hypothetical protein
MGKKQGQITFGFCDVNTGQRVYPALTDSPEKLPPAQQLYMSNHDMYASITCSPSIGQPTIVPINQKTVRNSPSISTPRYADNLLLGAFLCIARDDLQSTS